MQVGRQHTVASFFCPLAQGQDQHLIFIADDAIAVDRRTVVSLKVLRVILVAERRHLAG